MNVEKRVQSVAKIEAGYVTENQDSYHAETWVVSDGAGGTGFFAADWAAHLCQTLPAQPVASVQAFADWYEPIRQEFFKQKRLEMHAQHPDLLDEYEREGSSATLVAVWPLPDQQLHVLTYGDSTALLFTEQGELKQRTISSLMAFTEAPYLLNSNEANYPEQLTLAQWPVAPGDRLLVATDSLSQWILIQYALRESKLTEEIDQVLDSPFGLGNFIITCRYTLGNSSEPFSAVLEQLWDQCTDEEGFQQFTAQLYRNGELAMDDYTLIYLRF